MPCNEACSPPTSSLPRVVGSVMRSRRRNGLGLLLALIAGFATHCSSTSKTERAPACAAGEMKRCVSPRGCDGVQTCNADGTAFTTCECIDGGLAGTGGAGGSSGRGGASGSGAASGSGGSGGVAGASGADGAAGASGTSGLGGAGGSTSDASVSDAMSDAGGGRGGTSGASGSGGAGGSAGVPDASPGCRTECSTMVTSCQSMVAEQCACSMCGCEVVTCLRNTDCLTVALCALQSCTSWGSCISPGGPCGAAYSALPTSAQPLAINVGSCLLNRACPTCTTP
jgi:hypothetical protein